MTAPVNLRRAACLFGAICLCAGLTTASAARDGAVTIAQNSPPPQNDEGKEGKEHKKDHGDKAQQKGPQGAQAPNAPPGNGKPAPGNGQPQPGPRGGEPNHHKVQHPVEQPQTPQQPPAENHVPKMVPPTTAPVVPQQQVSPQPQQEHEKKHRAHEEQTTQPAITPPVAPNGQLKVVTPPPVKSPFSVVPPGAAPPAPGKTQVQPATTPFTTVPGMVPGKPQQPQGTPLAPAPQNSATPIPTPTNAQPGPDTGFKHRSTTHTPGAATERAALPTAPTPQGAQPGFTPKFIPGFQPAGPSAERLQDLQKNRTQRTEEGGRRTVIEEPDNRVIVKQDNHVFVRHDETGRLATRARDVHSQRRPDGTTETVIVRPGGVLIYNVVDNNGRLIRRYRRDEGGREINIIDNRRFFEGAAAGLAIAAGIGIAAEVFDLHLGPPRIGIPRERYIVDYDRASDDDLYEALTAPPVDRLDRAYSLEEIRYNVELRDRMCRVDLDTINFDFGAWDVPPDQYGVLARIASAINRAVDRNPGEVFLIEGYTDAVGSEIDNLSLSDRRAQAVAEILTQDFEVPPENLVTQGYGEEYLKIPTPGPERANRRVAVRRITPLLAHDDYR